jgi:predicted glutamine amidotransferase
LLYSPKNSLILQSYKSKERKEPLNGDGFGVGWYLRKRWTDILLLQRPLSAKIYLRARQREAWEIGK